MYNDMEHQLIFSWNCEENVLEVYLHCKLPSLAQTTVPELKLKLSDEQSLAMRQSG